MPSHKLTDIEIEYIIQNFDFHKVHKVMEIVDWQWAENGVPTIDELRKQARELLEDVREKGYAYIRCGGFAATNDGLIFELESYQIHG